MDDAPPKQRVAGGDLDRLLEAVPQQIFALHPDLTLEYASRELLTYHGEAMGPVLFSRDVAERDRALHHPDDLWRLQERCGPRLACGLPVEAEGRLLGRDGIFKWFLIRINPVHDAPGRIVRWVGTRTDIDELKRGQEWRERDGRPIHVLVDLVPHPLLILDSGGRIVHANRTALAYVGRSLAELLANPDPWHDLVHPTDAGGLRARLAELGRGPSSDLALRLRRYDGRYRWLRMRHAPLHDDPVASYRWYVTLTEVHDLEPGQERAGPRPRAPRADPEAGLRFEEIVGTSPALQGVLCAVSQVAPSSSTVLITGETGTGKELVARAIHRLSPRAARAFVGVNCGAIAPALVASELFGHERGAFTGAVERRLGRFELANGGTLFLDEVGDLAPEMQLALLRVLQEREVVRVGSSRPIGLDVRIVAATNRDLQAEVARGAFRVDLLYRLHVFPIEMPALRERVPDIPLLVAHFTDRYARQAGKTIRHIDERSVALLCGHDWPGNVRELQNIVERAVIVCESETLMVDPGWLARRSGHGRRKLADHLAGRERDLIEAALAKCGGRVSGARGAAQRLGMPASTLESRIRSLGIDKYRFKRR